MKVISTLNEFVLIRPRDTAQKVSGIEIPESVDKEMPTMGEVVLSPDARSPKESDLVIFSAFKPVKVMHGGEELLLVNREDIYAILGE